tara:strand:- start:152 stop:343 length:192 start_codon:yes stop_codon:yes gene_type:complete
MEKWADKTAAQIYIAHDIHPLIETELAPRGVHRHGPSLHHTRPSIVGLEYEMDCRRVFDEIVL